MAADGFIDSLQWDTYRYLYRNPLQVPDGELRRLAGLLPGVQMSELPVSPEHLQEYEPWHTDDIERFYEDYPFLRTFSPVLRFSSARIPHSTHAGLSLHKPWQDMQTRTRCSVRSRPLDALSLRARATLTDTGIHLHTRSLQITPVQGLQLTVGTLMLPAETEPVYGYFPAGAAVLPRNALHAQLLFPSSRRGNGICCSAPLVPGHVRATAFYHVHPLERFAGIVVQRDPRHRTDVYAGVSGLSLPGSTASPGSAGSTQGVFTDTATHDAHANRDDALHHIFPRSRGISSLVPHQHVFVHTGLSLTQKHARLQLRTAAPARNPVHSAVSLQYTFDSPDATLALVSYPTQVHASRSLLRRRIERLLRADPLAEDSRERCLSHMHLYYVRADIRNALSDKLTAETGLRYGCGGPYAGMRLHLGLSRDIAVGAGRHPLVVQGDYMLQPFMHRGLWYQRAYLHVRHIPAGAWHMAMRVRLCQKRFPDYTSYYLSASPSLETGLCRDAIRLRPYLRIYQSLRYYPIQDSMHVRTYYYAAGTRCRIRMYTRTYMRIRLQCPLYDTRFMTHKTRDERLRQASFPVWERIQLHVSTAFRF
jgi:hypothetical protein